MLCAGACPVVGAAVAPPVGLAAVGVLFALIGGAIAGAVGYLPASVVAGVAVATSVVAGGVRSDTPE